jgi:hypothetical protein
MSLDRLRGLYPGKPAYIVGKAPSLAHLREEHFIHADSPVIVLNDAILKVQEIRISNPIYSLQKDGCGFRSYDDRCVPDCGDRPHMVYPNREEITLIQQREYSPNCLPSHGNKIWIESMQSQLNLLPPEMAIIMAIEISFIMGCSSVRLLCCDSLDDPDSIETYDPKSGKVEVTGAGYFYKRSRDRILKVLEQKSNYVIITPKGVKNDIE